MTSCRFTLLLLVVVEKSFLIQNSFLWLSLVLMMIAFPLLGVQPGGRKGGFVGFVQAVGLPGELTTVAPLVALWVASVFVVSEGLLSSSY